MKVADMHCDTILAILRGKEQGKEISLCKNNLNVDLERMKKGDYLIQNFALFLDLEDPMLAGSPFRYAMKMADVFYREMEKNKDWIRPVTKYDEIEENRKNGRDVSVADIGRRRNLRGRSCPFKRLLPDGGKDDDSDLELSESAWISGKSDWRRICRKSLFRSRIWAYSAWN